MLNIEIISQADFLSYTHAVDDINLIYKCNKKGEIYRLGLTEGKLKKLAKQTLGPVISLESWRSQADHQEFLKHKIAVINQMHAKLENFQTEQTTGEYLIAADLYNKSLKAMNSWNQLNAKSKSLPIQPPISKGDSILQPLAILAEPLSEDDKALKKYFDLLVKYPELKRTGEENDYSKGMYQIIYDEKEIKEVQQLTYERLLKKTGLHDFAAGASRPGVVFEDAFWLILRDAVISPVGYKHTYNRFLQKTQLSGSTGAIVMPIVQMPNGEIKISLLLNYRHATQRFEFELPRGGSKAGESPEETAIRELKSETGYEVGNLVYLGGFSSDSGVIGSLIHSYIGTVTKEGETEIDNTEAITGTFQFSIEEINNALKIKDAEGNSYLEVMIEGQKKRYIVADPFLIMALYYHQLLSNP